MRKWVCMLLAALLCMVGTAGAEPFTFGYIQGEAGESAILYEKPSEKAKMLGCYVAGTPVTVIGWEVVSAGGQEGWCYVHLSHSEEEGMLCGYMKASALAAQASAHELPTFSMTLREGEKTAAMGSDDRNLQRMQIQPGETVTLLGLTGWIKAVMVQERTGTLEGDEPIYPPEVQQVLDGLDPAYLESVREEREKWAAYELYEEQMTAKYGASEWQWPLEVRKEHNQRAEACGLYNHWVDDLPRPGDITQEEALAKANACFEAMWDRPVSEGWHTVMAFGYNRMQPAQRLWEVRYSQEPEENGGPFFLIQLRAEDGMLQRTSDTEEFANYLVTNGESWGELLLEWEERRGCPFDEWTLEQQYEFAQLPLVQLSGALTDVTLPRPGDVAEEDALNVARMAIIRKYGVSEAELDAMKLRKVARKSTGEWGWYYGFAWCSWVEEEQVWGVIYDAYIDMGMGTVLLLQGPGEGNG